MCWSMGGSTGEGQGDRQGVVRPIRFKMYNIQNGLNSGLESALRRMSQAKMDTGIFQETNLTKSIYTRESSGYRVVAMEAPSAHSGGVAMFYRAEGHFSIEAIQTYRANIVRFQLASGNRQGLIVGWYLAPEEALTIEDVVAAISQRPQGDVLK